MSYKKDKPTILIIEDEPDTLFLYGNIIESSGFNVILANDGDSGIIKAKEIKPASILLDLKLPPSGEPKEGFKVVNELKKDPTTSDIPIIILTAYISEENKKKAQALSVEQYHEKPLNEDELIKAVTDSIPKGDIRAIRK